MRQRKYLKSSVAEETKSNVKKNTQVVDELGASREHADEAWEKIREFSSGKQN